MHHQAKQRATHQVVWWAYLATKNDTIWKGACLNKFLCSMSWMHECNINLNSASTDKQCRLFLHTLLHYMLGSIALDIRYGDIMRFIICNTFHSLVILQKHARQLLPHRFFGFQYPYRFVIRNFDCAWGNADWSIHKTRQQVT